MVHLIICPSIISLFSLITKIHKNNKLGKNIYYATISVFGSYRSSRIGVKISVHSYVVSDIVLKTKEDQGVEEDSKRVLES